MCSVFFSVTFFVRVWRVFSVTLTCVHVWCIFLCDVHVCSCVVCVLWCVLFNDFLVCVCVNVRCVFSVAFRRRQNQIILSGGGVKFVKNTSPALVTFSTPRYKNLTKIIVYLQKQKKVTYIFHPPPLGH